MFIIVIPIILENSGTKRYNSYFVALNSNVNLEKGGK